MVGIKELGIGEKGEMRVGDEGRVGMSRWGGKSPRIREYS
jgi:hypothetical protein